jgi:hypothetical protein
VSGQPPAKNILRRRLLFQRIATPKKERARSARADRLGIRRERSAHAGGNVVASLLPTSRGGGGQQEKKKG